MQSPELFVIAPHDLDSQPVLEAVTSAAQEAGLKVGRVDPMPPGALATSLTLNRIRQADLIVADVSRQNSNVMYELGFAHALRKQTILLLNIKSDDHSLPSDLTGFQYFVYDPADLLKLTRRVTAEIEALMIQRRD